MMSWVRNFLWAICFTVGGTISGVIGAVGLIYLSAFLINKPVTVLALGFFIVIIGMTIALHHREVQVKKAAAEKHDQI